MTNTNDNPEMFDDIPEDDVIDSGLPYGRDDIFDELESMTSYTEARHASMKDLDI